jgi:NAD dependent epimerase/dehydratase family
VYRAWAARGSGRSLTIVRPTVVFGPDNRGNVYTLLAQIARGRSVVIGDGRNRKSMAYVENVAELLVHALSFGPGVHVYNYADKPDLDMNELTALAAATLGDDRARRIRIPYLLGLGAGFAFDLAGRLTGWRFPVSAVRVRKYRANTQFSNARVLATGFVPRHDLRHALTATIHRVRLAASRRAAGRSSCSARSAKRKAGNTRSAMKAWMTASGERTSACSDRARRDPLGHGGCSRAPLLPRAGPMEIRRERSWVRKTADRRSPIQVVQVCTGF